MFSDYFRFSIGKFIRKSWPFYCSYIFLLAALLFQYRRAKDVFSTQARKQRAIIMAALGDLVLPLLPNCSFHLCLPPPSMTAMAGLFRLSVWIRQIHSYLTETLGIPVWGSYLIFALVTLVTGLLLGLILVLIADCICPSRPRHRDRKSEVEVKEDGSEGDIEDTLTEERQLSDAENESAKLSGEEESTGEEVLPSEGEVGAVDTQTPEGASESMVRKRKPQGAEANET